jgi:hypothetical protein
MDGAAWHEVAAGNGEGAQTTVNFPGVQARFVRVTLTSTAENSPPGTVQSFRLYAAADRAGAARR